MPWLKARSNKVARAYTDSLWNGPEFITRYKNASNKSRFR